MLFITPYRECAGAEPHLVNEKVWMIVYMNISFMNVLRDSLTKKIDKAYNEGQLTYK